MEFGERKCRQERDKEREMQRILKELKEKIGIVMMDFLILFLQFFFFFFF